MTSSEKLRLLKEMVYAALDDFLNPPCGAVKWSDAFADRSDELNDFVSERSVWVEQTARKLKGRLDKTIETACQEIV